MNNVQLITKFATEAWDKVYKKDAISSILDGEKDLLQFTGVRTVKIAKFSSDGLGNYQRANYSENSSGQAYGGDGHNTTASGGYGYPQGDVSLVWEEFTLRCDRAKQLSPGHQRQYHHSHHPSEPDWRRWSHLYLPSLGSR